MPMPFLSLLHRSARVRWAAAPMLLAVLSACSNLPLPEKPVRPTVYDFGPGQAVRNATPSGKPITLPELEASRALTQVNVMYRLAYQQSQSPQPYAQATWSMPPAHLLHQRLRATLGEQHPVLRLGDGLARLELRIQLEEFSQVFTSPQQSHGLVRLRVTALAPLAAKDRLLEQRVFELQAPAPTPDAIGGVHALTAASDAAAQQITQWVQTLNVPDVPTSAQTRAAPAANANKP